MRKLYAIYEKAFVRNLVDTSFEYKASLYYFMSMFVSFWYFNHFTHKVKINLIMSLIHKYRNYKDWNMLISQILQENKIISFRKYLPF